MRYIIRVKGHLDLFWQDWFDKLTITHESDGTTLLSGPISDQAALYGILFKLLSLGLTLLELHHTSAPTSPEGGMQSTDDGPSHLGSRPISEQDSSEEKEQPE